MTTARTTLGYLSAAHMVPGIYVAVEHGGQLYAGQLREIAHDGRSRLDPKTRVVLADGERRVELIAPSSTPCDLASDKAVAS